MAPDDDELTGLQAGGAAAEEGSGEAGDIGVTAGWAAAGGAAAAGVDIVDLYVDVGPAVRRFLRRSGRTGDAEDLAHDAFERTISHRTRLDGSQRGARAYLFTVTGNLVRDRWRREQRARAGNVRLRATSAASAEAAEVLAVGRLEGASVRLAFDLLDPVQREVLRMRVVEGRSSAEVAEVLHRTPASIRQIQHRALATLRTHLEASGWSADGPNTRTAGPAASDSRRGSSTPEQKRNKS